MEKKNQLTFHIAEFTQYTFLLKDSEINSYVSDFLLKYVSVEAFYKKMLQTEKERKTGKKLTAKDRKNLKVNIDEMKRVLEYYDIAVDKDLLDRVFGSDDKNYMTCSIKKLRDRLVHGVNANVLRVIIERYNEINNDLEMIIKAFTKETI